MLLLWSGSDKAHQTGISGKLPVWLVTLVPSSTAAHTCEIPRLEYVATILVSDDPTFTLLTFPTGNVAPVILVTAGVALALSSISTLPPVEPRNKRLTV